MIQNTYIVATTKYWNVENFTKFTKSLSGNWILITDKSKLTLETLSQLKPKYIFFPHWSWIVPKDIYETYDCVCMHMTDLPFGRGGSPLQNLILQGLKNTQLTALKMTGVLDGGPIYAKLPLSLEGTAQEIYERAGELCYSHIEYIINQNPMPVAQNGEVVEFARRLPLQSELPKSGSIMELYNFIRMLDADTYPLAFIDHGTFNLYLDDAVMDDDGSLSARVKFKIKDL